MRKTLSIIIVFCLFTMVLVSCRKTNTNNNTNNTSSLVSENNTKLEETDKPIYNKNDILVVFFSATGTTKGVAQKIADITGADLKEIVPEIAYTSADLNYGNSESRATKEQNTQSARPKMKENISIEGYKTIYLGYPIWWGQAPRIMSTFVENSDFTGVTVIPFCTSGSSDIGQSDDKLAEQANGGEWVQGKRFSSNASVEQIQEWINEMNNQYTKKQMILKINNTEVPVTWESNNSVNALAELVSSKEMVINMSMYGGFEQVGSLGADLPRNDKQTTTNYGDIVLYSGNQIVIFYGSNSWSYTRLGHINLSEQEMTDLLSNGNVSINLKISQ